MLVLKSFNLRKIFSLEEHVKFILWFSRKSRIEKKTQSINLIGFYTLSVSTISKSIFII